MPGKNVTNVEFGGKDMKTLYITEVQTGAVSDPDRGTRFEAVLRPARMGIAHLCGGW
jgi:sugar lactone lactonase YvrE